MILWAYIQGGRKSGGGSSYCYYSSLGKQVSSIESREERYWKFPKAATSMKLFSGQGKRTAELVADSKGTLEFEKDSDY